MRILVTNDDGIHAPGLAVSEAIANEISSEVWVVAPATEQSGVSHCISYTKPMMLQKINDQRFAVGGSPADCVIMGLHHVMREFKPDLIISGVNKGHNFSQDTLYSGTVGAAIEAEIHGFKAIALSQVYTSGPDAPDDTFAASKAYGTKVVQHILELPWPQNTFFNVNFPPSNPDDVKGMKLAPQGRRNPGAFDVEERIAPGGKPYYWNVHTVDNLSAGPDSDSYLASSGWISVTPMKTDLTDYAALAELESVF